MDRLPTLAVAFAALTSIGVSTLAASAVRSAPSHSPERVAVRQAPSRLSNAEVTAANARTRTFTVAVAFSATTLSELPAVGAIVDVSYSGPPDALAATTVRSGKSNASDRAATAEGSLRLSGVEVTEVDRRAKRFTVAVELSVAEPSALPAVGTIVDVTYAEPPGGGPLQASNLNSSKSNVN